MEKLLVTTTIAFAVMIGSLLVYSLQDQYHYVHHDMTFKWKGR